MSKAQRNWLVAIAFLFLFSTSMTIAREAQEVTVTRKKRGMGFQEVTVPPEQMQCPVTNQETIPSSFTQEGKATIDKNFDSGESTMLLANLSAGEYEDYCPIPSYKEQDRAGKDIMQKGTSVEKKAPARR